MIQKKICLLGAFAVGKTSLINRFVKNIFDDKYLSTLGVHITKKTLSVDGEETMLMIWDLAGENRYNTVTRSYLRGAAGYILVVDGTRADSLDTALSIQQRVSGIAGDVPFVIAVNKVDLQNRWAISEARYAQLANRYPVFRTSARSGQNVEKMFSTLVEKMS